MTTKCTNANEGSFVNCPMLKSADNWSSRKTQFNVK